VKKLLTLLIFIGFICVSCEDDEVKAPTDLKLHYYTESFEIPGFEFDPQNAVFYEYDNSGKLKNYTFFGFDPSSDKLEEQRSFEFSYLNGTVDKIEGFLVNSSTPYISYSYQYQPDSRVSKITEQNTAAGINSEANFSYQANGIVKVAYQFSNGGSFEYEFHDSNQNIVTDKTTRGAQLCSDGLYSYDENKSPFRTLGYLDYLLLNWSANNRLTENVNYVGCAFPSLIPISFEYEYNADGFPTVAITKYKSGGAIKQSRKQFFYKEVRRAGA
jgi:hypothetical protein